MSEINLTLEECVRSVTWALGETAKIPYAKGSWNAHQFLIKEHCLGLADAGATAYKCAVGFNIDFDVRCTCCGEILERVRRRQPGRLGPFGRRTVHGARWQCSEGSHAP